MKDILTYISASSAGGALFFSIQDIYSIAGIVCTVISAIVLIVNFLIKLYDRIKDKKFTKQEISDTLDDLDEFTENLKKLNK